jgi:hypothetical protein
MGDGAMAHENDLFGIADWRAGTEDNYQWTGEKWPDGRYLLISLWGEVEPNRKHHQLRTVRGWRCRHDVEIGKFDVPPIFAKDNAAALTPE